MTRTTQSATVTNVAQSGTTVTVTFATFSGLQNFQPNETVQVSGLPAGLNGSQEINTVNYASGTSGTFTYTVGSSNTLNQPVSNGAIRSEIGGLDQLGFANVAGTSSDTGAAFHPVPNFNLPTPNGFNNSSIFNYVGNQGYYGTALTVNPYTTTAGSVEVYAGGEDSFLQIKNADSSTPTTNNLADSSTFGPFIHVDHHAIAINPATGSPSSFTVLDGSDGGVWSFNPNGTKGSFWTDLNTNLQVAQFYGVAVNPLNSQQIFGGVQDNGNVRTLNAGQTPWQAATNDDGSSVFIDPTTSPETVYLSVGANIVKSNAGQNPYAPTTPPSLNQSQGTFWSYTAEPGGAVPPNQNNSGGTGDFPGVTYQMQVVNVNGTNTDYLWYGGADPAGNAALWMSTNGAGSWSLIGSPTLGTGGNDWVPTEHALMNDFPVDGTAVDSIGVNSQTPSTVYVGLRGGSLLMTTNAVTSGTTPSANGNASWTVTHPVTLTSTTISAASAGQALPQGTINVASTIGFPAAGQLFIHSPQGTAVITYTGTTATSFTGCAGGQDFTLATGDQVTFQDDLRFSSILVDPNNAQIAYVTAANFGDVTGGAHVWMTTNGGATWTSISGNLPNVPVWSLAVQAATGSTPAFLYVGTDVGVYVSSNGGATWAPLGTGLPNVQVRALSLYQNASNPAQDVLVAGTWGRGAFETSTAPTAPATTPVTPPPTASSSVTAPIVNTSIPPNISPPEHIQARSRSLHAAAGQALPPLKLQVLDGAGHPVGPGVRVDLRLTHGKLTGLLHKRTDKHGQIDFKGLKIAKAGHYTLVVTVHGTKATFKLPITITAPKVQRHHS
jgi:hypothetical protein